MTWSARRWRQPGWSPATWPASPFSSASSTDGPIPGELSLSRGLVTRRQVYVAGATTAAGLAALTTPEAVGLHDALQSLTAARYAAVEHLDAGAPRLGTRRHCALS